MSMTAQLSSYNAKQFDSRKRKQLALDSMNDSRPITTLADENNVSRKFIYQQKNKAINAVHDAFEPVAKKTEKVLFYLPVTLTWLCQLIVCLLLHCRANYRGIVSLEIA